MLQKNNDTCKFNYVAHLLVLLFMIILLVKQFEAQCNIQQSFEKWSTAVETMTSRMKVCTHGAEN